ncbi:MAG: hypothetical protein RR285_14680 [Acinetobacter sp.]
MKIGKSIFRILTLTLWVIALLLALELLTGVALRIGSAASITPLISFHNFCVSATQNIILAAFLLTILLILFVVLNKNNGRRIKSAMSINEDFISLKASAERQLELYEKKQTERNKELNARVPEIEREQLIFKEKLKYDEVTRQAHEKSLLTKVTRCTVCMNKLAQSTELEHEVAGLTDETQTVLSKLNTLE